MFVEKRKPNIRFHAILFVIFSLFVATPVSGETLYEVRGLRTLGGSGSNAKAINNNGQIVGHSNDGSGNDVATLFDPTGGGNNIALGGLGGSDSIAL